MLQSFHCGELHVELKKRTVFPPYVARRQQQQPSHIAAAAPAPPSHRMQRKWRVGAWAQTGRRERERDREYSAAPRFHLPLHQRTTAFTVSVCIHSCIFEACPFPEEEIPPVCATSHRCRPWDCVSWTLTSFSKRPGPLCFGDSLPWWSQLE